MLKDEHGTEWWTAKEAAEHLDVSQARVRGLRAEGILVQALEVAGRVLVRADEVRAYAPGNPGWPRGKPRGPKKPRD